MKILAAAVAASVLAAPAPIDGGQTLYVSAETVAQCRREGGCSLVSEEAWAEMQALAYQAGVRDGQASACKRPSQSL